MDPSNLSPQEEAYFKNLFEIADADKDGNVGLTDAQFFRKSNLPNTILGKVWQIADTNGKGHLSKVEFFLSLRLIALAQKNEEPSKDKAINTSNLIPNFPDYPVPQVPTASSPSSSSTSNEWTISPEEKHSYYKIFENEIGSLNGFISGQKARDMFTKSGLPMTDLAKIWKLSDIGQDHQLDKDEFAIAMFLINLKKKKPDTNFPDSLPSSLLPEQTSSSSPASPVMASSPKQQSWKISTEEREKYLSIFKTADSTHSGFITGDGAKKLFLRSGLKPQQLGKIWTLSDIDKDNKLSQSEFIIAMYLINSCLKGKEIPDSLPQELKDSAGGLKESLHEEMKSREPSSSMISPKGRPLGNYDIDLTDLTESETTSPVLSPSPTPLSQSKQSSVASFASEMTAPISVRAVSQNQFDSASSMMNQKSQIEQTKTAEEFKQQDLSAELSKLSTENNHMEEEIKAAENELKNITMNVKQLEQKVGDEKMKKIANQERLKYLQLQIKSVKEQKELFENLLQEKSDQFAEEEELFQNYETELKNTEQEIERLQNQVKKMTQDLEDIRNKRKSTREQVKTKKKDLNELSKKRDSLEQEIQKEKESNQFIDQQQQEEKREKEEAETAATNFFASNDDFGGSFENGDDFAHFDFDKAKSFDSPANDDPFSFPTDLKDASFDTQSDTFGANNDFANFGSDFSFPPEDDTGKDTFGQNVDIYTMQITQSNCD